MADLASILKDPNYINANEATKAAIFDKWAPQDPNFTNANIATQDAIRVKFGVTAPAISNEEAVFGKSTAKAEAPVSMRDRIMGVVELPAVLAGGVAAGIAAPVAAMYGELTSPAKQGSPQARAAGEAMAAKAREQFYQPRTQTSQEIMNALAPVMEAGGAIPSVNALQMGQAAGPAMRAVGDVRAAQMGSFAERNARVAAPAEAALQAERVAESTRNAPRIEAAQAARKYDIAVNPADANPTKGNKVKAVLAGNKGLDAQFSLDNVQKFNAAAAKEMGLPENMPLTKPAFTEARNLASGPYRAVEKLPVLEAPADVLGKIAKLKGDESLIGGATSNAEIAKLVDDAQAHISAGMAGDDILKNIRQMRSKAQRTYKAMGATPDQIDVADARMGIANALEDLIDSNIQDPKLLSDFRKARVAMAKTYAYEAATDLNTGNLDPQAIAKITAASNELTGTIADIGKIAGNFPSVSQGTNVSYSALPTLTRSGLGGSVGYALGSTVGMPLQGSIAGAGIGGLAGRIAAKRMGTSEYQAAHAVPTDYRPPVNNLRPADINYGPNQLVPYDFSQATTEAPNFVLRPNEYPPKTTFVGPDTSVPQLGMSREPVGGQMGALRAEDARVREMQRAQDMQAQAQAEAAAAAARQPTRGGSVIDIDPVTGKMTLGAEGTAGMTPDIQVIESTGSALASAARKIAGGPVETTETKFTNYLTKKGTPVVRQTGQTTSVERGASRAFDLTAEEKIAWDKTRADLAEVMPEFKKLDDKEVVRRMTDVKLSEEAVKKAREKAAMFDDLAKRMESEQTRRDAAIKRDQMLDLADLLDENMRAPRPVSKGGQGPKTRAHQRNMLAPEQETKNNLPYAAIIDISGVGKRK